MPNILKRFTRPETNAYEFPTVEQLAEQMRPPKKEEPPPEPQLQDEPPSQEEEQPPPEEVPIEQDPIRFAQVQAEAILQAAREEAEQYKEEARLAMIDEMEKARQAAREEGYTRGYADGIDAAAVDAKEQRERMAAEHLAEFQRFMQDAIRLRDQVLDKSREDLKDLALVIAEKVIRISLRNSTDVLLRMVDAATDTHRRCEWAHIYVADCDVKGKTQAVPELAAALRHLSGRVRVIPMSDDESGTCIIELPDVILDASVSTQLNNIKEVLDSTSADGDDE